MLLLAFDLDMETCTGLDYRMVASILVGNDAYTKVHLASVIINCVHKQACITCIVCCGSGRTSVRVAAVSVTRRASWPNAAPEAG